MSKNITDFVIPLHRYHYMVKTLVESINVFYSPKNIYIVTPECYCEILTQNKIKWKIDNIIVIPEEYFFLENFNLHYNNIQEFFTKKIDEKNREFGWWYQQLIKLGAFLQIKDLSDPYIVWDSDLIPITRWEIYPTPDEDYYKFAILQQHSRNEWLINEYKISLFSLTKLALCDPTIGTFVPHHFVIYHNIQRDLFKHIETITKKNWIESIISISNEYFRFSEYRAISSFMNKYYPERLNYHSFEKYGSSGKRIREPNDFLLEMEDFFTNKNIEFVNEISYDDFIIFVKYKYNVLPSYLQIEHI
jgi:hypothetical protein